MSKAHDELIGLLDLEGAGEDRYRGGSPPEDGDGDRIYGGQLLAQAIVAASRSVDDDRRGAHSFHAYFLRAGVPTLPIEYAVERSRDGGSFSSRRVSAAQGGRTIFEAMASFHGREPGYAHQRSEAAATPPPADLPSHDELLESLARKHPDRVQDWMYRQGAFEQRIADGFFADPMTREPLQRVWIRASGELPESPAIHQALLAYASDLSLIDTAALPQAVAERDVLIASLDHAMWFHRPFRMDDWLLFVQESPTAADARGFTTARIYTPDGELVATAAQEGLLRPPRRAPEPAR